MLCRFGRLERPSKQFRASPYDMTSFPDQARATAATLEKERNEVSSRAVTPQAASGFMSQPQASTEACELRACNARLEEAVSSLQACGVGVNLLAACRLCCSNSGEDRNKELWQKEFLGSATKVQPGCPQPAAAQHSSERMGSLLARSRLRI